MRTNFVGMWAIAWLAIVTGGLGVLHAEEPPKSVDYLRDVKPILQERCFACHGVLQQQAELRLDTAEFIRQGGDGGPAIVPGNVADSTLLQRIADPDEATRMPPEGEPLTAEQIARVQAWIAAGAIAPPDEAPEADPREHWAFQPLRRPDVPSLSETSWVRNPIDAFIAQQHQQVGLEPQAEAPRSILIRRLYLDLVGLPPTAQELAAIGPLTDDASYEQLVKTLLDDPRHGERWARHWMDVWRYSDWWGLGSQLRNSQQHMWHWRDWIIESLNDDLPYDEMVRLMLAGDELAPTDPRALRATGFLARNFFLFNRHQWMDETVEHVGKGFLGLTLNCAKCHDHKYDPLAQTDYYRMRAFFEPYHVRLDMVPGQANFDQDGIPRAFDALTDTPTYRFIRGEENQPDKSTVMTPGVPEALAGETLPLAPIRPVDLPPAAWQPERQPWVYPAHRAAKDREISAAEQKVRDAQQRVAAAEQVHAKWLLTAKESEQPASDDADPEVTTPDASSADRIVENFQLLDDAKWERIGGQWAHEPGRLSQQQDGATRSSLRWLGELPKDLDVSLRFTILGGSQWRSVGISVDATRPDPAAASTASNDELFIYASAVAGGSKVQAAYRQAGQDHYPGDGARAMPIEVNREYTLRVQIRDTLVNASLNGEPVVAWSSPLPRQAGALLFTTFDALTVFHEITIQPLAADQVLRPAAMKTDGAPTSVAEAEQAVAIAQAELALAVAAVATQQAERESLDRRAAALRSRWDWEAGAAAGAETPAEVRDSHTAAIRSQRQVALAQSQQQLADARVRLARAAADQRAAIEKEIATQTQTIETATSAIAAAVDPQEAITSFVGAKWTPTRFLSSGADDPAPTFPAQSSGRRTALAAWITDPRNPLTARVAVNHIWMRHLGEPLVPTVFDFGRQAAVPSHPELLDWLASELIDSGWSMKHIHHLIVTSATYRMSSSAGGREANVALDADNRHLWRRTPIRIESQVVRDSILALAGALDLTLGGPAVPPNAQADSKRRSLYFFHSNNERDLFLTMFDEATVTECYRRDQSIVPQQALALINSRLVLEAADPIAHRVGEAAAEPSTTPAGDQPNAGVSDTAFIRSAFELILGMAPSDEESHASGEALAAWRGLPDMTEQQARANLIWSLLNHNDFVTLR